MNEKTSEPEAFILFRGEYDKRRDQVKADTPKSLPPLPDDLPHNRLGLAKWLLATGHPLTARVTVNRFWQEVFGTGLVRTSGDFGIAGELPSHPELLDWLAIEFREPTWNAAARPRLGREEVLQADRDVGHLPPGRRRRRRRSWRRTATTGCCRAARGSAWTPR